MKRIGTEDGTREYQPLALEVVGGVDIGEYDYSELREVEPVNDGLIRKGDMLGLGFVWDVSEVGVIVRQLNSETDETYFSTIRWGEDISIQEQNPLGGIIGKVEDGKARPLGYTKIEQKKVAVPKAKNVFIHCRLTPKQADQIAILCTSLGMTNSQILRQFVEHGINQKSMKQILGATSAKEAS